MLEIKVKNNEIKKFLENKLELVELVKDMLKRADALNEEHNKILLQLKKITDNIRPLVIEEVGDTLAEFEYINEVRIDGDDIVISIANKVEDYKEMLRNPKKEEPEL